MPVGPPLTGALRWMAKFDISPGKVGTDGWVATTVGPRSDDEEANYEPAPRVLRLGPDSIRMRVVKGDRRPIRWGLQSSSSAMMFACLLAVTSSSADSRVAPDPPPRSTDPHVGPSGAPPSWDLDGLYLWLGPQGAASRVDATWDSTFGAEATIVRVREDGALGVVGGSAGASLWTARNGGRIWLDAVVGTRLAGRMYGATLGPIVELSERAHPRLGGSVGVWAFFGVAPYARVGIVDELGVFGEVGLHIALPVVRR
jgi:hypothetical protein